ncbi:dynein regulatory complex protein 1-like [Oratosquilla oratoria]|uniref:dynein regulatory complex protein 1-like n=1 Tax=Oratosquilla oratoria TaxID=337810 RepID=UPI003F7757C1
MPPIPGYPSLHRNVLPEAARMAEESNALGINNSVSQTQHISETFLVILRVVQIIHLVHNIKSTRDSPVSLPASNHVLSPSHEHGAEMIFDEEAPRSRQEAGQERARSTARNYTSALHDAERTLHVLLAHGCQLVGNVEVAAMTQEATTVSRVESLGSERRRRVEEDHRRAREKLECIRESWQVALKFTIPEELHRRLMDLKASCDDLMHGKRTLIEDLRGELQREDANYAAELLQQAQDRSELLRRITEHVSELHLEYRKHLRELQSVATREREALLKFYSDQWDEAIAELNAHLQDLLRTRLRNRQQRLQEVINLKLHGTSDHAQAKEQLDEDIEKILLKEVQLKTRRQLEEGQLAFNELVLEQQYRETTAMVSEGRRRLNALRLLLNNYKRKVEHQEALRARADRGVYRDVLSLKEQLQALQGRLKHASTVAKEQLAGVRELHYENVHNLVRRLVDLDRSIERGVLAKDWLEPDLSCLKDLDPALQAPATETPAITAAARILGHSEAASVSEVDSVSTSQQEEDEEFLRRLSEVCFFLVDVQPGEEFEEDLESRIEGEKLQRMNRELNQISQQLRMREEPRAPPPAGEEEEEEQVIKDPAHQKQLLFLEQIFWEVGVHNEEDVHKLLKLARRHLRASSWATLERA